MSAPASFFAYVAEPVRKPARIALVALCVPLLMSLTHPLWQIRMVAPQYPEGLELDIYANELKAGHDGWDLNEINGLNHYIGMHEITREELRDLDWIPFALLGLAVLALRVAAIGDVRSLIDLAVLTLFVGGVSIGRFAYMLYRFGHDLDPRAPVTIEPFMPALIGEKQVANFLTSSYPRQGTWLIAVFATGVLALTTWHLVAGWRAMRRDQRDRPLGGVASPA